jgi:hypothetical protein
MASDETANLDTLSEPMRRVLSALMEGETPPSDAHAALTAEERAEIAVLGRTANLAYLTLHQPEPSTLAQAKALDRARNEMTRRQSAATVNGAPPSIAARPALLAWLERLRRRKE